MLYLLEMLEHQAQKIYLMGKRWSEVQLLKGMLLGVSVGRKVYLGSVGLMFFAMVLALSFSSTLLLGAFQLEEYGVLYWNWPLGTSVVVFGVSLLIFMFTAMERTWLNATGVKKKMREVYGPYHANDALRHRAPAGMAMDRAEMEYEVRRSVDETVQKRMREEISVLRDELRSVLRANEQAPTPPNPPEPPRTYTARDTATAVDPEDERITKSNKGSTPPIH